jgi:hypothetical protein
VRFLEVGTGGFLGIGEKRFLVPVEAVTQVAEGWVTIEADRTERVAGSAPFDTKVKPPPPTNKGASTTLHCRSAADPTSRKCCAWRSHSDLGRTAA